MFYVFDRQIFPEKSETLFQTSFSDESLKEDWEITGGDWRTENGVLVGKNHEDRGGIIYSKRSYSGDVMLDFYGVMVPPCKNDLNFTWKADGWDFKKNDAGTGYIGGLNGWWTGKAGIEKYPDCTLRALTDCFPAESGQKYHIQAGSIEDYCFLAVDGRVVVEFRDPQPIRGEGYERVGLGVYCSNIEFSDFRVMKPKWHRVALSYLG